MNIIIDIVVLSCVYLIGFKMGMKYASDWWNQRLNEVTDELQKHIIEKARQPKRKKS